MHGDGLEKKVQKWFDFPLPAPAGSRDFINEQIELYENKNRERAASLDVKKAENLWWLGGKPVRAAKEYRWLYLMEEQSAPAGVLAELEPLLLSLRPEASEDERTAALKKITAAPSVLSNLKKLLGRGLVLLDF